MTVQTSVKLINDRGFAGMVGDSWNGTDIASMPASGNINPGLAVVAAAGLVAVPAGNLTGIAGVATADASGESTEGSAQFVDGSIVPVLKKGRVWCITDAGDTGFTVGQVPLVRHTADGELTVLGALGSEAGTGLTAWTGTQVTGIQDGLVEISINLI